MTVNWSNTIRPSQHLLDFIWLIVFFPCNFCRGLRRKLKDFSMEGRINIATILQPKLVTMCDERMILVNDCRVQKSSEYLKKFMQTRFFKVTFWHHLISFDIVNLQVSKNMQSATQKRSKFSGFLGLRHSFLLS